MLHLTDCEVNMYSIAFERDPLTRPPTIELIPLKDLCLLCHSYVLGELIYSSVSFQSVDVERAQSKNMLLLM